MLFLTCSFICWTFFSWILRRWVFSFCPTPVELLETELLLIPPSSIWGFCLALLFLVPIQLISKAKDAKNSFTILFFYRLSLFYAIGFALFVFKDYTRHFLEYFDFVSPIIDSMVVDYLADAYADMIPNGRTASCSYLCIEMYVWLSTRQCAYLLVLASLTFVLSLPRLLRNVQRIK